ncbi:MAG TPA: DUF2513 domain-containing protein [Syntrophorhabdaceae bacterium]|nr:DUF2513 domain-containing protein [Syntrophorhabdaceae bacterium]
MKRDLDLIRLILKEIEATPAGKPCTNVNKISVNKFPGYDEATIREHIKLLIEEGFVKGETFKGSSADFDVTGLTWKGYDFLDSEKDEKLF